MNDEKDANFTAVALGVVAGIMLMTFLVSSGPRVLDPQAPFSFVWWVGNYTNGFIGAAFGAGAAIWYAERKERQRDTRKRDAICMALFYELQHNKNILRNYTNNLPKDGATLSRPIAKQFEKFVELFDVELVSCVSDYTEQVVAVEAYLSRQPVRSQQPDMYTPLTHLRMIAEQETGRKYREDLETYTTTAVIAAERVEAALIRRLTPEMSAQIPAYLLAETKTPPAP